MWTEMKLEPSRRQVAIAGQVKDAQTDRVIPQALVTMTAMPGEFQQQVDLLQGLYGTNWHQRPDRTRTDGDGYFYFLDLPDGDYTLRVDLPGVGTRYGNPTASVTVSQGVQVSITKISLLTTSLSGNITGVNSRPLVMAKVQVEGSGEYTFSDSQGNYRLTALESGNRRIKITAQGYHSKTEQVVLNQGQMQTLNISLTKATTNRPLRK